MRGSALPGLQSSRGQICITVSHFTHRTLSRYYLHIIYTLSIRYLHVTGPIRTFTWASHRQPSQGAVGHLGSYAYIRGEPSETLIWRVKLLLFIHYVFIVFFVSVFGGRQHQFDHSLFIIFLSHLFIVTWWMIMLFTVSTKYAFM